MRILIDTNVFIHRENHKKLTRDLQSLFQLLNKTKTEKFIHPLSHEEISRDSNIKRKKIVSSKIKTYPHLESPPIHKEDNAFLKIVGIEKNRNDYIDNALIYALYRNAVDFLLTEDLGIHRKLKKLQISQRVMLISELKQFLSHILPKKITPPPFLEETKVYNLDISDPFFNSLKKNYPEFDVWFKKICLEGRDCYVYHDYKGNIRALLIYKIEDESINSTPPLPRKRRLKLSTFKVTYTGYKIGELFIKLSVEICLKNNLEELYLTHFTEEKDYLILLIEEYGFYNAARNYRGEEIFLKRVVVDKRDLNMSPVEISKEYYPSFCDGIDIQKFIVPIRPGYHNRLFERFQPKQRTLNDFLGRLNIEGNAIKKAYLTHSRITGLNKGDVILFYRSRDMKSLTSIGVIEDILMGCQDPNEIISFVGKRTVYSKSEIDGLSKKPTTAILFTWHFNFTRTIPLLRLKEDKILKMAPQSIQKIPHEHYLKIKELGVINERFTLN